MRRNSTLSPYEQAEIAWRELRKPPTGVSSSQYAILTKIAKAVGMTPQAVHQWTVVPFEHVAIVAEIVGKRPWQLRPDRFVRPPRKSGKEPGNGNIRRAATP